MGLVWGGGSLLTIRVEGLSLPLALFALGGTGMVLAVGYGLYTTDPAEFSVNRGSVIAVVAAALLTLVAVAI
jgi:hypothetical protein